jgi:predicted nucleic acid-binding protein
MGVTLLLDTNVISALMREVPDPLVVGWLDRQRPETIWISSVALFELRHGLEIMTTGRRRDLLWEQLDRLVRVALRNRIKHFDAASAKEAAKLGARRKAIGRPVDMRDLFIAGIAISVGAAVVTRNVRHFSDLSVPVINPWDELLVS